MKTEGKFALIQLNDAETRHWNGRQGKARADVQRKAREQAMALAREIGAKVEICGDGGDVLEVVDAASAEPAVV